jgi:hypothetical protein
MRDGGCWWEDKEKTKGQHGSGHISTAQHSTVQQALFYISLARSRGEREKESKEREQRDAEEGKEGARRERGKRSSVVEQGKSIAKKELTVFRLCLLRCAWSSEME